MVRLEGFEPPTIRVEAEYSNPLSYSRMYLFMKTSVFSTILTPDYLVGPAGFEPAPYKL